MSPATPTADRVADALAALDAMPLADWRDAPTHRTRQARIAADRWREQRRRTLWDGRQQLATSAATIDRRETERRVAHQALDEFEDRMARPIAPGVMRDRELAAAYQLAAAWLRGKGGGSGRPGAVIAFEREHRVELRSLPFVEQELTTAREEHDATKRRLDEAIAAVEAGPPAAE